MGGLVKTERDGADKRPYQQPSVTQLGSVLDLTRGNGQAPNVDAGPLSV